MDRRKELMSLLQQLNLKAFVERYPDVIADGNKSTDELLVELCKLEMERRYTVRTKRRIRQAGFPKVKTLAMLSYDLVPKLPRQMVETLATCRFITKKENVILVGDSGGGKTHLAIALGIEACKQDYSVKFFTTCQLVNTLLKEYKAGDLEKFMSKVRKYQLCIIDEIGYVPLCKEGAELLFQVFSDRYEAGSTIITSNLNFSRWTEVFIDKAMTTALLDRLTHNATIIKYDWGSVRFNQALEDQKKRRAEA